MRNAIGQKLDVGTPVVVVSQGQGWTALGIGRVEKFSKQGYPQVRYLGNSGKAWSSNSSSIKENGKLSPPLQRYERIFVITQEQYDDLADTKSIVDRAQAEFDAMSRQPELDDYRTKYGWSNWEWNTPDSRNQYTEDTEKFFKARKEHVNAAMRAAGKDNYYD